MPTIFFYCPQLEREQRKKIIKSFTKTASEITGIEESAFVVYIRNVDPEYAGVGGELLEDRLNKK